MIAVIASMEAELQFTAGTDLTASREEGPFVFREYRFGSETIVTAVCGTGKVAAAICVQKLLDTYKSEIKLVVSVGTAGALVYTGGVNSVIVVNDIVQHDFDLSPFGYRRAEQSELKMVEMPCDEGFLSAARKVAGRYTNVTFGRALSGDRVIVNDEEKKLLTSEFGGVCCDMECAAVAEACLFNKVAFAAVKGISDGDADEEDRESEFRDNIVSASANLGEVLLGIISEMS